MRQPKMELMNWSKSRCRYWEVWSERSFNLKT